MYWLKLVNKFIWLINCKKGVLQAMMRISGIECHMDRNFEDQYSIVNQITT